MKKFLLLWGLLVLAFAFAFSQGYARPLILQFFLWKPAELAIFGFVSVFALGLLKLVPTSRSPSGIKAQLPFAIIVVVLYAYMLFMLYQRAPLDFIWGPLAFGVTSGICLAHGLTATRLRKPTANR